MNRCVECLIPDTRPDTAFVDGVCSACINFKRRAEIDWSDRKDRLEAALETGKNGSGFDCIVPSSGGKDSHYQVLKMIELGARPLVVTASTCMLTELGRKNIDNLARYATTIEVTPNREVRAKLNRFGLLNVGDISYPEHLAIFSIPFQMAAKLGIPLIFYGESPQQEYGCPSGAEEALTMTRRWVAEFGGLLGLRARDCVGYDGITERDMRDYHLPDDDQLKGVTAYFLGQFIPWDSRKNAEAAIAAGMLAKTPCSANWWHSENLDNAMTGLHDHAMYRKYGYGRGVAQMSVDLRNGMWSRESMLQFVKDYDGLFPFVYGGVKFEEVCDKIEMTRRQVIDCLDKFTDWSLFDGVVNHRPILKEFAQQERAA